jgi:hypothetical protein
MIDVQDMVKDQLVKIGAQGLVNADSECGCPVSDLSPAACMHPDCVAAMMAPVPAGEDADIWFVPMESGGGE